MKRRHSLLGFAITAVTFGALLATAACEDDETQGAPGGSAGRGGSGGTAARAGTGGSQAGSGVGQDGAPGFQGSAGSPAMGSAGAPLSGAGGAPANGAGGAPTNGAGGAGGSLPAPGVAIATGQANVAQLTSDGTTLFWVTRGTEAAGFSDGKVLSCPVDGCPETGPTVLAENQKKPEFISLSDENYNSKAGDESKKYIFWTTSLGGEVLRCEKTGCGGGGPTVLASGQNGPAGVRASLSLPQIDPNAKLVVLWANVGSGDILQCPHDGCGADPLVPIVSGRATPRALLTGNSFVYWMEEGTGEGTGVLYRFRKDRTAGEPPVAQTGLLGTATRVELASAQLFAVDRGTAANQYADGAIYWANPNGDAKNTYIQGQKNLFAIVGDGKSIFWNADGKILSCPFGETCTTTPAPLADGGAGQSELALDTKSVYFFVGDSVRKLGRPDVTRVVAPGPLPSD